jgi:hypothetical protein
MDRRKMEEAVVETKDNLRITEQYSLNQQKTIHKNEIYESFCLLSPFRSHSMIFNKMPLSLRKCPNSLFQKIASPVKDGKKCKDF